MNEDYTEIWKPAAFFLSSKTLSFSSFIIFFDVFQQTSFLHS